MSYMDAYRRLSWQKPIPFSEMRDYHEAFEIPYTLGVFVDAMRTLEYDDLQTARDK